MDVKEIIKEFNDNKIECIVKARIKLSVGEPCFNANYRELVQEDFKIMNTVGKFLYWYELMEISIQNYKERKKYDKETQYYIVRAVFEYYEEYKKVCSLLKEE